ncbi:hypothetical protein [Maridesulfovibrio sp.]|uniref:hypothetical protein n=1 Tax=Maridesulfovibrio sp. TaxID=2795000 RepID=UPI002A189F2E|nr:hypothetical protein [Maridesulfovibrio sp.]
MKTTINIGILVVVSILVLCGTSMAQNPTFNAQGSAIVPHIFTYHYTATNKAISYISLSNITDTVVNCKIVVYDHEGEDVTNRGRVMTGDNTGQWTTIALGTGEFEIPPHGTRMYMLDDSANQRTVFGHALVKWTSNNDKLSKALVGQYRYWGMHGTGSGHGGTSPINNGQPF